MAYKSFNTINVREALIFICQRVFDEMGFWFKYSSLDIGEIGKYDREEIAGRIYQAVGNSILSPIAIEHDNGDFYIDSEDLDDAIVITNASKKSIKMDIMSKYEILDSEGRRSVGSIWSDVKRGKIHSYFISFKRPQDKEMAILESKTLSGITNLANMFIDSGEFQIVGR